MTVKILRNLGRGWPPLKENSQHTLDAKTEQKLVAAGLAEYIGDPKEDAPKELKGVNLNQEIETRVEIPAKSTSPVHGVGSSTQTEKAGVADAPPASLSEKKSTPKKPASKPKSGGKDE